MIRRRTVISIIGLTLQGLALLMLLPLGISILYGEWDSFKAFAITVLLSWLTGTFAYRARREGSLEHLSRMEGISVAVLSWLFIAAFGSIPYICFGLSPDDAFFESMSGFTTTGSTILIDFSVLNDSMFFFRGYTHFVGGIGILVLFVAIFPRLALSGRQLFFAESSAQDKLTPRIKDTARGLLGWYILLTLLCFLLLMWTGMSPNHAIANSFATLGTGGLSPNPQSIMGYNSKAAEWILIFFMFVAGSNLILQLKFITGQDRKAFFNDPEIKAYAFIVLSTSLLLALIGFYWKTPQGTHLSGFETILDSLRTALFQNISVMTTTGAATQDFNLWPDMAKVTIILMMFIGGCTGSTSGGLKVGRLVLLFKYLWKMLLKNIHEKAALNVKYGKRIFTLEELNPILTFILTYFITFFIGALLLLLLENDMIVAFSGSIACLGNVGPGFGAIGPLGSFGTLQPLSKILCSILMWAGRLEITALLIFLRPEVRKTIE
ncbi:MAG: TrkH family potassium uptake protein [Candidatus Riflebacteria bacterium]|nr:TrkH family potassium uptake protein [Candidatus Riflebacteria bacterium]